jgi:putative endonuclease
MGFERWRTNEVGFVYIMASQKNGRSTLARRATSSNGYMSIARGWSRASPIDTGAPTGVVEVLGDVQNARLRELQMKKWMRAWKIRPIEENNLDWMISIRRPSNLLGTNIGCNLCCSLGPGLRRGAMPRRDGGR